MKILKVSYKLITKLLYCKFIFLIKNIENLRNLFFLMSQSVEYK